MSRASEGLSPDLHRYLVDHGSPPDALLLDLAEETTRLTGDRAGMQIAPEQGAFLTWLSKLLGVRSAVEVGTFTGYSSVCIARGLAPGGRLLCCDVSEEWTAVARRYWDRAGVADRVELRLAPALDTLRALPLDPVIDLAFVDADKGGYLAYWEELVPRMRTGGVVAVDNVLYSGQVLEPATASADGRAIAAFNDRVLSDDRVELVMLPVADGLTLARRLG